MSWLKRWFGWGGGQEGEDEGQQHRPDHHHQQQQPGTSYRRQVVRERRRQEPLLRYPEPGELNGGGVQGLDWYRGTLVKDQDGDVAHEFLEEPAGAAGPVRRDSLSPDHKRQKTTLQSTTKQLAPAGPSDMLVERGNVVLIPKES